MVRDTFTKTIKAFEANYRVKLDKSTIDIYWETLKDYKDEEIKKATIILIKELTFLPRIADIVIIIEGSKEEEAELAWIYLKETIEKDGYYRSVSFPEYPAVGAVVENIGGDWCGFIDMITDEEEKWIKKDFLKIYPIMKKRGGFPHKLVGRFELDNLNKGYTEESMLERYGKTLDGRKVDRKLIREEKERKLLNGDKTDCGNARNSK